MPKNEQPQPAPLNISDCIIILLMVVLVLAALSLVTYNFVVFATPDLLPPWAAIPLGIVLGFVVLIGAILLTGPDILSVIVEAAIIILLMVVLLPTFSSAKNHRLHRKHRAAPAHSCRPTAPPRVRYT